jgi:hypothetical protein
MKHNNNIKKNCWNINMKLTFWKEKKNFGYRGKKTKCNKHVCVNHIDKIHGCSKRIP